MKITKTNSIYNNQSSNHIVLQTKEQNKVKTQKSYTPSSVCQCAFGSAQVNMQRDKTNFDKLNSIVNSIIDQDTQITKNNIRHGKQCAQIGKYIEDWKLYDTVAYAAMYPNDSDVYLFDKKAGEIKIFDENAQLKKEFSQEDVNALHYYKYHPDSIHILLREGRELWKGNFLEETKENLNRLDKIFSDPNKTFTNKENRVLYRALQDKLSDEDIQKLSTVGEIFVDKSFVSTTTNPECAQRFKRYNPIMEIEFPKDAKYIDMDKLFNIDREHWHEDEFLLDRNSKFLVTGFDVENNIIKVKYCN